jgi:CDP-diacylglycerol--glycerol-3-phosphate 3-phosphatidyltransferase
VTLAGLVTSVAVVGLCWLGDRWVLAAAVVVGASGVLDSVDGAVAVLSDRVTAWGAVLDSVVDRLSDVLYLVAMWLVGAPAWACASAGAVLFLQEYARARAGVVGMDDVGIVTIGERPTRVVVVAMFLLAAGIYVGSAPWWATTGVAVSLVVSLVSLAQLLVVVRRRLT